MNAVVYTDASHCQNTNISTCGFLIIYKGKMIKHTVEIMSGFKTSTLAEAHAITQGLQYAFLLDQVSGITLYSDCKTIVDSINHFPNRNRTKFNYPELLDTRSIIVDFGIWMELKYVKSHSGDKYNTLVDKSCNKILKQYLKEQRA